MSFAADNAWVYGLFNRSLYQIPRNQRKYVWSKDNWVDLFNDINYSTSLEDPDSNTHFLGSVVLKIEGRRNGLDIYTIIDGQQRIISLSMLLTSVLYWMKYYQMDTDVAGTKRYIITNDDEDSEKLMVTSEYHRSFEMIVQHIIQIEPELLKATSFQTLIEQLIVNKNKDRVIASAFNYFLGAIKDNLNEDDLEYSKEYLINLRNAIVNSTYVSIISSTDEDSYTIFEILNARGVALEDHELLKNYIMRYILPEGKRDDAKTSWNEIESLLSGHMKEFIKHYSVHKFGYKKTESPYATIKKSCGNNTQPLLNDLRKKADFYYKLLNPIADGDYKNCNETEYLVFSFLRSRRQSQMRPILLSLIHHYSIGSIPEDKYVDILKFIYHFNICYTIIGQENSNKLTHVVNKYAKLLENDYSEEILVELADKLKEKLPAEETFVDLFNNIGWSHHKGYFNDEKNKTIVQIVLESLERHLSGGVFGEFSIEHVLADGEDISHARVGNLIPLEENLNKSCNGKPFEEKMKKYSESNFKTARRFAERYKDGSFNIDSRTQYIAKLFYRDILKLNVV